MRQDAQIVEVVPVRVRQFGGDRVDAQEEQACDDDGDALLGFWAQPAAPGVAWRPLRTGHTPLEDKLWGSGHPASAATG